MWVLGRCVRNALTALMIIVVCAPWGRAAPVSVYNGDAFTRPPTIAAETGGGGSSARQTGTFTYAFPIEVPPGRMGLQPSLALSYSSDGAIYGGVAAGWNLGVPTIALDTRDGILDGARHWISSLGGERLTRTFEPPSSGAVGTYRAPRDGSGLVYERQEAGRPFEWIARDTGGNTFRFGRRSDGIPTDVIAPLAQVEDAHGNLVEYDWVWETVPLTPSAPARAYRLATISYTSNPSAGLPAFARVELTWTHRRPCANSALPVGSQLSLRSGSPIVHGYFDLDSIATYATGRPSPNEIVRRYDFVYDKRERQCDLDVAPRRVLSTINTTGWSPSGAPTTGAPVSFSYSSREVRAYDREEIVVRSDREDGQLHTQTGLYVDNMLVDLDGDGLPDRLTSTKDKNCDFYWQRNNGFGFDDARNWVQRPELPNGPIPPDWKYDDGPNGSEAFGPRCALNAQYTLVTTSDRPDANSRCRSDGENYRKGSVVNWRFFDADHDGLVDMVAGVDLNPASVGTIDFDHAGLLGTGLDRTSTNTFSDIVDELLQAAEEASSSPVDHACEAVLPRKVTGRYPWLVYRNTGGGNFAASPQVWGMPVPLVSTGTNERSQVGEDQVVGPYAEVTADIDNGAAWTTADPFSMVDLDGDGFDDIVSSFKSRAERDGDVPPSTQWQVLRGRPNGMFEGTVAGTPFLATAPPHAHANGVYVRTMQLDGSAVEDVTATANGLAELNGDGVPDFLWIESDSYDPSTYQSWNVQAHALLGHGSGLPTCATAACRITAVTPLQIASGGIAALTQQLSFFLVHPGFPPLRYEYGRNRFIDVDGDGRADLVTGGLDEATVRINIGDTFLPPRPLSAAVGYAATLHRFGVASSSMSTTMLVDVDGDGRVDPLIHHMGLDLDGDGEVEGLGLDAESVPGRWSAYLAPHEPPGVMRTIHNGVGGETHIDYASSRDDWVVDGWRIPGHQWVVSAITTSGHDDAPNVTTRYRYRDAVWAKDEHQRYGFRGFREVSEITAADARVTTEYSYDEFHGGLPVETRVAHNSVPDDLATTFRVEQQQWQTLQFHAQPVHVLRHHDAWTCGRDQTADECKQSGNLLRTTTDWEVVGDGGGVAVVPRVVRVMTGVDPEGLGTRISTTTYEVARSGSAVYVLPKTVHATAITEDGTETTGFSETLYDPTHRRVVEVRKKVDDARLAVARFGYDEATGLLRTTEAPESVAAGLGQTSSVDYDDQRRFVVSSTNVIGHRATYTTDPGTGLSLSVAGPQYKCPGFFLPCIDPYRKYRRSVHEYDGLGRLIKRYASFDESGVSYVLREVERASYTRWSGSGPRENRTIVERLVDATTSTWTREESFLDGVGRVVRLITRTFDPTIPDAVVTTSYDDRGFPTRVQGPDPSRNDGSTVHVDYEFDELGRRTHAQHSSGLGGVRRHAYEGLAQTSWIEGDDGGPRPMTKLRYDALGRLAFVEERISHTFPPEIAVTEYRYDANDNLATIVDADGLITQLDHDLAGNRRWVERGGRRWSWEYDLEGRIAAATVPHPDGQAEAFTTRNTYDALGRLATQTPGPGNLTPSELAEVAHGPITYTYDSQRDALGNLSKVVTSGGTAEYLYDATGNVRWMSQRFHAPLAPTDLLQSSATYNALGAPLTIQYPDGVQATYTYDGRGLPASVKTAQGNIAQQRRNSTGLVYERTNRAPQAVNRTYWAYDSLGRITNQKIMAGTQVLAGQGHAYFNSGDTRRILEFSPAGARDFWFDFDDQGQLRTATDQLDYTASYEYTPGGRLLGQSLQVPSTADVDARDVYYVYDDQDLERVRALHDRATGNLVAALDFDEAGNVIAKDDQVLRYDGMGRLRIAIRGNQREVYHYDSTGRRSLAIQKNGPNVSSVRRWFGGSDFRSNGGATTASTTIALGGPVARVRNNQVVEFLHHGVTGNLLLATSYNGQPIGWFSYGAFGEILEQSQPFKPLHRTYQDGERDQITDWYAYGYRLYDRETLLWNRADPLYQFAPDAAGAAPRRMSLYTFNLNNPLRYIDPDGRDAWELFGAPVGVIADAIGGFIGGVGSAVAEGASAVGSFVWAGARAVGSAVADGVSAVGGAMSEAASAPAQVYGEFESQGMKATRAALADPNNWCEDCTNSEAPPAPDSVSKAAPLVFGLLTLTTGPSAFRVAGVADDAAAAAGAGRAGASLGAEGVSGGLGASADAAVARYAAGLQGGAADGAAASLAAASRSGAADAAACQRAGRLIA